MKVYVVRWGSGSGAVYRGLEIVTAESPKVAKAAVKLAHGLPDSVKLRTTAVLVEP